MLFYNENIDLYLKKGNILYFRTSIVIALLACTLLMWFCYSIEEENFIL